MRVAFLERRDTMDTLLIERLVKGVKNKLSIKEEDTRQDNLIKEEVQDLIVEVLEYCKLKELPKPLGPFVKRQVMKYILSGQTGIKGTWDEENVKSISRGDTSVTLLSLKERLTVEEIAILDKYRPKKVIAR